MKKQILHMAIYSMVYILLYSCAHKTSLSGGKKDITPPKVVAENPPNGSTRFEGKKFSIEFDEYVQLENINQKALISPPVEVAPDYQLRGKSMIVKFNEELKPNTTYSVYFGDAIVDLTEGNPITNYSYIFSTGDYVDSLSIHGEVINAFDLSPVEETYIMLYKDNNDSLPLDSLPYFVKPYYISKTDEDGHFRMNGLSGDDYLCFALKDLNSSYTYDQPSEEIAFLDSLIRPEYVDPSASFTAIIDSLTAKTDSIEVIDVVDNKLAADTLKADSLAWLLQAGTNYELFLFQEKDSIQKFLKVDVPRKNVIQFSFAQASGDIIYQVQNDTLDLSSSLVKRNKDNDTVTWYLRDYPLDTLELMLMLEQDTLEHLYVKVDPTKKTRRTERKKDKDKEAEVKTYLKMKSNVNGGNLVLNSRLQLNFDYPIISSYTDSILMVVGEDSTYNPAFQFTDSLFMDIVFPDALLEETQYALLIPDSAFTNWNGDHNEAFNVRFSTKPLKYYGVLSMNLHPEVAQPYVFQMLTEDEKLVKEITFNKDTSLLLNYIEPSKYIFKLVVDDNANGEWDPGIFSKKIQAEKVIYYEKIIQVRGNWEIEESWFIKPE